MFCSVIKLIQCKCNVLGLLLRAATVKGKYFNSDRFADMDYLVL